MYACSIGSTKVHFRIERVWNASEELKKMQIVYDSSNEDYDDDDAAAADDDDDDNDSF